MKALGAFTSSVVIAALLGVSAHAHVIPLDVTLTRQAGQVQALIQSPDGLNVSGVRLAYQLNGETPVPFHESTPGTYQAALQVTDAPVRVRLIDRTFPSEASQVQLTSAWPPVAALRARIPARLLTSSSFVLTPSVLLPVLLAVLIVVVLGVVVRHAARPGGPV